MKLTNEELQQIIQEELEAVIAEKRKKRKKTNASGKIQIKKLEDYV